MLKIRGLTIARRREGLEGLSNDIIFIRDFNGHLELMRVKSFFLFNLGLHSN